MSTENEGTAVTPAAGPTPTQGTAASGTPADSPAPQVSQGTPAASEEDFALPSPEGTAPGRPAAPAEDGGADDVFGAATPPAAEQTTRLPRITSQDGPAPSAGGPPQHDEETASAALPPEAPRPAAAGPDTSGPAAAGTGDTAPLPPVPAGGSQPQPQPRPGPPSTPAPDLTKDAPTPAVHASDGYGQGGTPPPSGGYGGGSPGPTGSGGLGGDPGGGSAGHGHGGGPHNPWNAPPMQPPPSSGGRRRGPGALLAAVVAAALIAGGVGGGIGFWAAERNEGSGSTTISADGGAEALNRAPDSVAGIAAKTLPSVVTIETAGGGESGTGTGFVFDKEGHILTNNHVVASAADGGKLTATFSDGKAYEAEIVGRAEGYDIAVIKLKNAGDRELQPVPLGDSEKIKVGDATIAIGAPYGLSGTVTTGIVSAKNRPVASSDGTGSDASYMNALQTDASINPGNSGGPLLNAQGAVIGVNSAIQSGGGGGLGGGQSGSVGLGFAIPVNQAKRVATQLIETGVPVYPVIGVRVQTDKQGDGAVIAKEVNDGGDPVTPGGPADKAGLEPGDVITEFDGTKIDSSPTLIASIWAHEPGETVKLTYERDGKEQTTEITLGTQKGDD